MTFNIGLINKITNQHNSLYCTKDPFTVMYITILSYISRTGYCLSFINCYLTEANSHSPLPGQQIPLTL